MRMSRARHGTSGVAAVAGVAVVAALAAGCASGGAHPAGTSSAVSSTAPAPSASATGPVATPREPATPVPGDQPSNGPNTISSPVPGATVVGPSVAVAGSGTAFEGTLRWAVIPAGSDAPVAEGYTTAGANGDVQPFEFTVTLQPGTMTLAVWEPDESDGSTATKRTHLTTVTFTVT